ncbi:MAG: restriction endonuclease, partial [Chloroflexota bacterium]
FELDDGIHKIWIEELAEIYLYSFLQQFLAYRTKNAVLAFDDFVSFEYLHELAEEADEPLVMRYIDNWMAENREHRKHKSRAILHTMPHRFAMQTGISIIVMFDEFQRLNNVLYQDEACTRPFEKYTDSYSSVAESSLAPMLIAGSQVTILTEDALMGSMMGRVSTTYIARLPIWGATELVFKFAARSQLKISLDDAYLMSRLVDGHPFYIWCLFNSRYPNRDLTTEDGIKRTLAFEVEDLAGHINEFWRYHFAQNMETFNLPHARQMIFYLTQYSTTEVRVEKLMKDLKLSLTLPETNETLRRLVWCDLVREEGNEFYGGLSDPQLAQMLSIEYSWEIKQLSRHDAIEEVQAEIAQNTRDYKDELIDKLRGELRTWVGRFAEMFIEKLMKSHFIDQKVDGVYFNQADKIHLSRFEQVFYTMTQPYGATRPYQIDVYGVPLNPTQHPWVVEVKNWKDSVRKPDVEKFWQAARNLAKDKGHPQVVCWFYARSGFTGPAKKFMKEQGILYTDEKGLLRLLKDLKVVEQWYTAEQEEHTT